MTVSLPDAPEPVEEEDGKNAGDDGHGHVKADLGDAEIRLIQVVTTAPDQRTHPAAWPRHASTSVLKKKNDENKKK